MVDFLVSLLPFAVLFILWVLLMGYLQRRRANDSLGQELESPSEVLEPIDARNRTAIIHTYR